MTDTTCRFEPCDKAGNVAGLCKGHYSQHWLGKPLTPLRYRARRGESLAWLNRSVHQRSTDCIEWPFGRNDRGYGQVYFEGRASRAHVVALNLVTPWHPPYGPHALHSCDNPICVNPAHLSWGTHAENMRQKKERGRAKKTP